ncbi:Uncharacterised protein [Vibrio cholerae]|uniref:Uncharacterized protein n=1 Tax=Vibrio cholerae TaxID=666 RepID=A0A655RN62_VIBCL|nr:Uncharacterised protein [Vibrio cholerae]
MLKVTDGIGSTGGNRALVDFFTDKTLHINLAVSGQYDQIGFIDFLFA